MKCNSSWMSGRAVGRLSLTATLLTVGLLSYGQAQQPPTQPNKTPAPAKPAPKPADPVMVAAQARLRAVMDGKKKLEPKLQTLKQSGQIAEADKAEVDQYFMYYLEILTSPAAATDAPEHRQNLRKLVQNFGNAKDKVTGLQYVNEFLLAKLSEIAADPKQSPHARYNCMLVIGELNELEPSLGGTGTVKPFPKALPALHAAAAQDDVLPAVRVAALIGVLRHAQAAAAAQQRLNNEQQLVVDLSNLIKQKNPPADSSADGHQWMRRRAMEIIATLKQAGPKNEAIAPLIEAVSDKTNSTPLRLDALRTLSQLKVPANASTEPLAPVLGAMTVDLMKNEPNRRALRQGFQSLLYGLKGQPEGQGGLLTGLTGNDKKRADQLSLKVSGLLTFVDKVTDPMQINSQFQTQEIPTMEEWLLEETTEAEAP